MLYFAMPPQGRTIQALTYIEQLQKLAEVIREKRSRCTSVPLLYDNARAHVAKETQEKLATLDWDTVPNPPSDYHLFRPLKQHLAGK